MKVQLLLLVASLVLTEYAAPVRSECCHPARGSNVFGVPGLGYCCDGSGGTPWCGYGKCNIFGCNCDGGCRRGNLCNGRKKRSAEDEASAALAQFDADGDGRVSYEEAKSNLVQNLRHPVNRFSASRLERSFTDLDLNSDGYISLYEVDSSA